jgi:hypothetical protein
MPDSNPDSSRSSPPLKGAIILALAASGVMLLAPILAQSHQLRGSVLPTLLLGFVLSTIAGIWVFRIARQRPVGHKLWARLLGVLMLLLGLGGPLLLLTFLFLMMSYGGAWGRPLRVQGHQLHPELRVGSDWTLGERADTSGLDAPTRSALEALWLHDAQKEHASVPAFARISWLLAATGAPADLMEWAHRAGLEEVDHARRCFALAAGYGGRTHSVEPMSDLLLGGLDVQGDPRVALAVESLRDGCLLEDFNADVAGACAVECRDPAARDVLGRIAREERSHAEFSWALLDWTLQVGAAPVRTAVAEATQRLGRIRRPTATTARTAILVSAADPRRMREHGRLPDTEWAPLWEQRLSATAARVAGLLEKRQAQVS